MTRQRDDLRDNATKILLSLLTVYAFQLDARDEKKEKETRVLLAISHDHIQYMLRSQKKDRS